MNDGELQEQSILLLNLGSIVELLDRLIDQVGEDETSLSLARPLRLVSLGPLSFAEVSNHAPKITHLDELLKGGS